ncbi:MAG: hypothetical protein Q4B77_02600 [Coriobacteriaceae bacterium]|nr:hypothetical protein [Coriobacteriaceae bacterium]
MDRLSEKRMVALLRLLNLVFVAVVCFLIFELTSGVIALLGVGANSDMAPFVANKIVDGALAAIPLLVFARFVRSVTRRKEFFSRVQSRRVLTIAICLGARVALGLFTPSIEVPALLEGAIGAESLGPSLNLTSLAIALMFFALAGVFEYGRKLQEDSDNIL